MFPGNCIGDASPTAPLRINRTRLALMHCLQVDFTESCSSGCREALRRTPPTHSQPWWPAEGKEHWDYPPSWERYLWWRPVLSRKSNSHVGCRGVNDSLEPPWASPQRTLLLLLKLPPWEYFPQHKHTHVLLGYYLSASCSNSLQQMYLPTLTDNPH